MGFFFFVSFVTEIHASFLLRFGLLFINLYLKSKKKKNFKSHCEVTVLTVRDCIVPIYIYKFNNESILNKK